MKEKSEASQIVRDFYAMVNTQFKTKVKMIRSDNGREFTSDLMKKFKLNKAYCIKLGVSTPLSRTKELKGNIDTF